MFANVFKTSDGAKKAWQKRQRGTPLKGHPYHDKTDAELSFIMRDAAEAAKAMQGHDGKAEAKYLDQVNDAATVMFFRKNSGMPAKSATKEDMSAVQMRNEGLGVRQDRKKRSTFKGACTTPMPAKKSKMPLALKSDLAQMLGG
jgi:hypothetical protein